MRRIVVILLTLALFLPLSAQKKSTTQRKTTSSTQVKKKTTTKTSSKSTTKTSTKKVDRKTQLRNEQAATSKAKKQSQAQLAKLNKSVKASLDSVLILDNQIGKHQVSIDSLNSNIAALEANIAKLNEELGKLQDELELKRLRYAKAIVKMRRTSSIQSKLMFVLSANNFSQLVRRVRYMKEYSSFQKAQGEMLKEKQTEVRQKQNELLEAKAQKETKLHQVESTKKSLQILNENCRTQVKFLNKNIATVQKQIKKYQDKEAALNAEIDRIIQAEIEAARRAEAERKRKAEEARKKAEAEARARAASEKKDVKVAKKTEKEEKAKIETWKSSDADADAKLSGSFASNKGRLPMPITGSYNVVGHYGNYTVSGLKNVTLNNKGIDIRGQQGCSARAVFDGVVSSVFQYSGIYIVMLRHGSYISVYSGLSKVSVSKGQKVSTRQTLGAVGRNSDGNYVLHFQLRQESTRLNPEVWVR